MTRSDKHKCALRELRQRRHVYPRLVAQGKMNRAEANWEIACMQAIADDYAPARTEEMFL